MHLYPTRPQAHHAPAQSLQCGWKGQVPVHATACTRKQLCHQDSIPSLTISGSMRTTPFTRTTTCGTSHASVWMSGTPQRTHHHQKEAHHQLGGFWPLGTKGRRLRLRQWSESLVQTPPGQCRPCISICGGQRASCGGRSSSETLPRAPWTRRGNPAGAALSLYPQGAMLYHHVAPPARTPPQQGLSLEGNAG